MAASENLKARLTLERNEHGYIHPEKTEWFSDGGGRFTFDDGYILNLDSEGNDYVSSETFAESRESFETTNSSAPGPSFDPVVLRMQAIDFVTKSVASPTIDDLLTNSARVDAWLRTGEGAAEADPGAVAGPPAAAEADPAQGEGDEPEAASRAPVASQEASP